MGFSAAHLSHRFFLPCRFRYRGLSSTASNPDRALLRDGHFSPGKIDLSKLERIVPGCRLFAQTHILERHVLPGLWSPILSQPYGFGITERVRWMGSWSKRRIQSLLSLLEPYGTSAALGRVRFVILS